MKKNLLLTGLLSSLMFLNQCYEMPEFPSEPYIEFVGIAFLESEPGPGGDPMQDQLILAIKFQDGDGNLGLATEGDNRAPFHSRNYYNVNNGNVIPSEPFNQIDTSLLIRYSDRFKPGLDTLPPFLTPFNCTRYLINPDLDPRPNSQLIVNDTVYFIRNPYNRNIFVDLYLEQGNEFVLFNFDAEFTFPGCGSNFHGRFPILNESNTEKPMEGTIYYIMRSFAHKIIFGSRRAKLRVWIVDRDLNKSNVIETPIFTLPEITIN